MKRLGFRSPMALILIPLSLVLLVAVACGTSAPDPAASPSSDTPAVKQDAPKAPEAKKDEPKQSVVEKQAATKAAAPPTAVPKVVDAPAMSLKPEGTLTIGLKEMGPFFLHPSTLGNPQIFVHSTAPIGEGFFWQKGEARTFEPMLVEAWSISDDFLTWTFNLQKGVQFHGGYGEMTAEDVIWSMRQWTLSKHPRNGQLADFWGEGDDARAVDPYTIVVNLKEPVVGGIALRWHSIPGGASTFIVSKKQTDELGVDGASSQIAATGPWEIVDSQTGEFWKMEAVEDHWRQTPFFKELIFRELPEESSRIAGFQTGILDTFLMSFDNIPLVEAIEGAKLMSVPSAIEMRLRIYGNWYPIEGVETRPGYDPELPWVSPTDDVTSPEWARATKVRQAFMFAIDREALVETILSGYGHTRNPMGNYSGFEDYLDGRQWVYDPDKARALLAEAGYADGFDMTLTPSIRGAPAETESCEIIAEMLREVGIDIKFQRIPYGTLRPQLVARTYQGATCHAGSPLPTPASGYGSYYSKNKFNRGLEHQYSEDLMLEAAKTVDDAAREALEREIGQWIFDNALTDLNYHTIDAVWPVGPRLEPWEGSTP